MSNSRRDIKLEILFEWGTTGISIMPCIIFIYLNDLADDICSKLLKFADEAKLFRKVTNHTNKYMCRTTNEKEGVKHK